MISPVSSSPAQQAGLAAGSTRVPQQTLGQNDFLRLLSVQLAQQDPTQPVESADFMGQMAQFSALEQSTQLTAQVLAMRYDTQFQAANSLLGREVTYELDDGSSVVGVVSAVVPGAEGVSLEVNGEFIPLDAVLRVTPPAVTQP